MDYTIYTNADLCRHKQWNRNKLQSGFGFYVITLLEQEEHEIDKEMKSRTYNFMRDKAIPALESLNAAFLFDDDGIPLPGVPYGLIIEADWAFHAAKEHGE